MTFYIGVDFHPHQQTLCYIDKQTGAMETLDLVKLSIMLRDNITANEFDLRGRTVGNARNIARSEMTVN